MYLRRLFVAAAVLGLMGLVAGARAAEMVDNPAYQNWAKYKPGTFVTYKSTTEMAMPKEASDAAPAAAAAMTMSMTSKLISIDADKAVVEMTQTMNMGGMERAMPAHKVEIPAKVEKSRVDMPAGMGEDKVEITDVKRGTDTVAFKDKKLAARTWEATMKTMGIGMTMHTKTWTSGEVPGGLVRMDMRMDSTREGPMKGTTKMELVDYTVVK